MKWLEWFVMAAKDIIVEILFVDGAVDLSLAVEADEGCGARCVFVGQTRAEVHEKFGGLKHLDYEVFEEMAVRQLGKMAEHAVAEYDCLLVRVLHSKGVVRVGECSVLIEVATGHRGESFEACRYLIEALKHELPIWKREIWEDGETFVKGCCVHSGAKREEGELRERVVDAYREKNEG